MTRIKEYQSDRNAYTKVLHQQSGREECDSHWWDVKNKCVFCGIDKPFIPVLGCYCTENDNPSRGCPLHSARTQQEAYDKDERFINGDGGGFQ